jgi:hypothetical protein
MWLNRKFLFLLSSRHCAHSCVSSQLLLEVSVERIFFSLICELASTCCAMLLNSLLDVLSSSLEENGKHIPLPWDSLSQNISFMEQATPVELNLHFLSKHHDQLRCCGCLCFSVQKGGGGPSCTNSAGSSDSRRTKAFESNHAAS